MKNKIAVLDHGFVMLHNVAGPTRRSHCEYDASDLDAPNAARMSFDNMDTERTAQDDLKLANYLMKNKHTSPFEQVEVWFEMKLPIFVARQFVRHRTVSLNEVSGRYVTLPKEWYIPESVGGRGSSNKQGSVDNLAKSAQLEFRNGLRKHCEIGYENYLCAIQESVSNEHARLFLSLNHYTHWIWKQNLHNLMHFLSLRDHSHAQIEAQAYAQAMDKLVRNVLPESMQLYDKYRKL